MTRSHRTAGLDQLGPVHSAPVAYWKKAKPHEISLNQRAEISRRNRRVKITLPSQSSLDKLLGEDLS